MKSGILSTYLMLFSICLVGSETVLGAEYGQVPVTVTQGKASIFAADFWNRSSPQIEFQINLEPPFAGPLILSANGFGKYEFSCSNQPSPFACEQDNLKGIIRITHPHESAVTVILKLLETDSIPLPTSGSVQIESPGFMTQELGINVHRRPSPAIFTPLTWVLGIGVPALLTFLLSLFSQKLVKSRDEGREFASYRAKNIGELENFREKYVQSMNLDFETCTSVYESLSEDGILEKMPTALVKKLEHAIAYKKPKRFSRLLSKAFPTWS